MNDTARRLASWAAQSPTKTSLTLRLGTTPLSATTMPATMAMPCGPDCLHCRTALRGARWRRRAARLVDLRQIKELQLRLCAVARWRRGCDGASKGSYGARGAAPSALTTVAHRGRGHRPVPCPQMAVAERWRHRTETRKSPGARDTTWARSTYKCSCARDTPYVERPPRPSRMAQDARRPAGSWLLDRKSSFHALRDCSWRQCNLIE